MTNDVNIAIIGFSGVVIGAVIGFVLSVGYDIYKSRKRRKEEIEAFRLKIKFNLEKIIIDLFRLENSLQQYEKLVPFLKTGQVSSLGFPKYSFQIEVDIPQSFIIQQEKVSKNIYNFSQNFLRHIDEFSIDEHYRLENNKYQLLNKQITKERAHSIYHSELRFIQQFFPIVNPTVRKGIELLCSITGENSDDKYQEMRSRFKHRIEEFPITDTSKKSERSNG